MSFWGPSSTQRVDQGQIAEIPLWLKQQMVNGFGDATAAYLKGQGLSDQQIAYLQQQIQQGFGSPQAIRELGQQIQPGINDLIDRRTSRVNQEGTNYNAMPGVEQTIGSIGSDLSSKGARIGQNWGDIQGSIDQGFGAQRTRTADTADTIGRDTGDTFGGLLSRSDTSFGDARSNAAQGFGAIKKNAGETYDQVRQRINQGRDAQLGTTARAFAPAMAATLRRIRASGIDPNSPEAASLLQGVDTARGHAFDDSLVRTQSDLNAADLAQQANNQGLDLSKLSNDQTLALQNAANKQGLTVQQYLQRTNLATQTRDIQNELDRTKTAADVQNLDTSFQRGQDQYDQQMNNELISRGLRTQDVGARNSQLENENSNEMTNQGLLDQQFQAGANLTGANNQRRDAAVSGLGQAAGQQYNVGLARGSQGLQNANSALQGFGTSYGLEAPSAGWGAKLLGGAASAAIQAIPGIGQAGAILGPAVGGGVAGGGGGGLTPNAAPSGTYNPWGGSGGSTRTPSWADIFKKRDVTSTTLPNPATNGGYAGW